MAVPPIALINSLLPGSGLVLRDHLALGLSLLLLCLCCLATLLLAELLAASGFAGQLRLLFLGIYVLLAGAAALAWWMLERELPVDDKAVQDHHRQLATAWLRGDAASARDQARLLVRLAPRRAGSWRLLAMACHGLGDDRGHRQAQRRLERILQRSA